MASDKAARERRVRDDGNAELTRGVENLLGGLLEERVLHLNSSNGMNSVGPADVVYVDLREANVFGLASPECRQRLSHQKDSMRLHPGLLDHLGHSPDSLLNRHLGIRAAGDLSAADTINDHTGHIPVEVEQVDRVDCTVVH